MGNEERTDSERARETRRALSQSPTLSPSLPSRCPTPPSRSKKHSGGWSTTCQRRISSCSRASRRFRVGFWSLIFDLCLLISENRRFTVLKPFYPLTAGESRDYGKMQVINKKVRAGDQRAKIKDQPQVDNGKDQYTAILEVLPEGCSNSVFVKLINVKKWPTMVRYRYSTLILGYGILIYRTLAYSTVT